MTFVMSTFLYIVLVKRTKTHKLTYIHADTCLLFKRTYIHLNVSNRVTSNRLYNLWIILFRKILAKFYDDYVHKITYVGHIEKK